MKKETVTVSVANQNTMRISVYLSETEGLAIHRCLTWVPAKEEHKFTSEWTITHIPTGLSILRTGQALSTMAKAVRVAELLKPFDWTLDNPVDTHNSLESAVANAVQQVENSMIDVATDRVASTRFVVRRSHVRSGFDVIDTETDQVVTTELHRGVASQFARERNESTSV